MSTSKPIFASVAVVAAGVVALGWLAHAGAQQRSNAVEGPKLGVPVTEADIASWDISVGPDGAGLPAGKGTAVTGAAVYQAKCLACHGEKGAGKPSDQLVGGQGTLRDGAAVRTVGSYWPYATTLFDYIRRAMPYGQPQSLTADEIYGVSAYLLRLNGVIGENDEMNATTLPKVKMPNRDGFFWAYTEPTRAR
jgi:S-disulfanyl-L-cysteine oxidoreductase SoxD